MLPDHVFTPRERNVLLDVAVPLVVWDRNDVEQRILGWKLRSEDTDVP